MSNTLKNYMNEEEEKKSDENVFDKLELTNKDIMVLKATVLSEDVSIPVLVNLVLREKAGNVIKEENKEELLMRGYISENDNVTEIGKAYIETEEVKERLKKLLDE